MFQENAARLSICFKGNDQAETEFASTDLAHLDTSLPVAEDRMNPHRQVTSLHCDRVSYKKRTRRQIIPILTITWDGRTRRQNSGPCPTTFLNIF